ncbi:MAG: 5-dehydro-2-deoxygluconokinase [Candidatus Promineifilaceae bacterium]
MPAEPAFDVIGLGRSSIDLYANDIGAPFEAIKSFAAYVGGTPTNIAVGARRLGLRSALLTAVGEDPVGDFVLHFLEQEGVETAYIPRKPGRRTSAVLLGVQPPDHFPLVYYRDNCADREITIADVAAGPIRAGRLLFTAGTGLSHEPSRSATFFAAEQARAAGAITVLDIDFRADQWHDPCAFGLAIRALLPLVDIAVGTEEEVNAALLTNPGQIHVSGSQISAPQVEGDLAANVARLLALGVGTLVVKRGPAGASVYRPGEPLLDVPGFRVEVVNVLGAGDAFATGLIYGRLKGWDWHRAARMGNACGAILVGRHGCANFMAYEDEALAFIKAHGGF